MPFFQIPLENLVPEAYNPRMDAIPDNTPPGWLEILEESEAELASGLVVSGEDLMRELRETITRLEAKGQPAPGR